MEYSHDPFDLHNALLRNGHHLWSDINIDNTCNTDVWPPPDVIITIALTLDSSLQSIYRDKYFLCLHDDEDKPLLQYEPCFALAAHISAVAPTSEKCNNVITGPLRWLLVHLQCMSKVLIWFKSSLRRPNMFQFLKDDLFGQLPYLQELIGDDPLKLPSIGAIALELISRHDCQILWDVLQCVAYGSFDFYVSDLLLKEVYIMSHHDTVVMSLPDINSRQSVLQELVEARNVFKDCSCYTLSDDEH